MTASVNYDFTANRRVPGAVKNHAELQDIFDSITEDGQSGVIYSAAPGNTAIDTHVIVPFSQVDMDIDRGIIEHFGRRIFINKMHAEAYRTSKD